MRWRPVLLLADLAFGVGIGTNAWCAVHALRMGMDLAAAISIGFIAFIVAHRSTMRGAS